MMIRTMTIWRITWTWIRRWMKWENVVICTDECRLIRGPDVDDESKAKSQNAFKYSKWLVHSLTHALTRTLSHESVSHAYSITHPTSLSHSLAISRDGCVLVYVFLCMCMFLPSLNPGTFGHWQWHWHRYSPLTPSLTITQVYSLTLWLISRSFTHWLTHTLNHSLNNFVLYSAHIFPYKSDTYIYACKRDW